MAYKTKICSLRTLQEMKDLYFDFIGTQVDYFGTARYTIWNIMFYNDHARLLKFSFATTSIIPSITIDEKGIELSEQILLSKGKSLALLNIKSNIIGIRDVCNTKINCTNIKFNRWKQSRNY